MRKACMYHDVAIFLRCTENLSKLYSACPHKMITWSLISPYCRTYVLLNRISIGSDSGMSPILRHTFV